MGNTPSYIFFTKVDGATSVTEQKCYCLQYESLKVFYWKTLNKLFITKKKCPIAPPQVTKIFHEIIKSLMFYSQTLLTSLRKVFCPLRFTVPAMEIRVDNMFDLILKS